MEEDAGLYKEFLLWANSPESVEKKVNSTLSIFKSASSKRLATFNTRKRFVDGIYTCKDIEELLADKKTDRSKDFDEASACL